VLALGILVLVAAAAPPRGVPPAVLPSFRTFSGAGLVLTANPSTGTAPLLVDFSFSTPNGTAPYYRWSFGDGSYLNGSGLAYATPSHTYVTPGSYDAVATGVWPAGPENASLTIVVLSPVLSIALTAAPLNGTAPLTVTFNATPGGGSGTYLSYLWTFGDGGSGSGLDIRYTYETAGQFEARLVVTDSDGVNATATANVTVARAAGTNNSSSGNGSSDGSTPGGSHGWTSYLPALAVAILVAGISVFLASAGWILYRRRTIPTSPGPSSGYVATPVAGPPPPAAIGGAESLEPGPTAPSAVPRAVPVPAAADPSGLAANRRLALQLLRYMGTLSRVPAGELPGSEWTQAGLAKGVGAGQSAISRVLRRLTAAGIVEAETEHVAGGGRRLRVYRLTPRGERLAHALSEPGRIDPALDVPTQENIS
jgi:DNA-binding MarR family transcriptional regulator